MSGIRPVIGVLALQGDFEAHGRALSRRGHSWIGVRYLHELERVGGLILPGGESTTIIMAMREVGLWEAIPRHAALGMPLLATCAGLILCARAVENPVQPCLELIDVTVRRNAWGRQRESFIDSVTWEGREEELVFIRAPRISAVGPLVQEVREYRGEPVMVRQGNRFGTTFHPELSTRHGVMDQFLAAVEAAAGTLAG